MTATVKSGSKARRTPATTTQEPAVLRFSTDSDEEEAREPLFYIDDVAYTIPSDPASSIGLRAQDVLAEERGNLLAAGLDLSTATMTAMGLAQRHILQQMLGEDGYQALIGYKKLKRGDLRRIMEVCSQKAYAALEDDGSPNS